MSERSEYKPGEFCWVDLATTDIDAATRFYGDLLGVEAEPAPGDPEETGGYGFFTQRGKWSPATARSSRRASRPRGRATSG